MLTGVASFAFMDAGLKLLTAHYPSAQVAALRGLSALPVVFAWALYSGGARSCCAGALAPAPGARRAVGVHDDHLHVRAEGTVAGAAYSLFFVAPMLIAVLSIVMLGEHVRRPQWIAIVVGFVGVLIVLKPESAGISAGRAHWPCSAPRCVMRSPRCW